MHSMMACQPTRIWPPTRIHPWENQYCSRHTIETCRHWPRTRRQQGCYCPSPTNMHPPYPNRTDNGPKCKGTEKGHCKQSTWCPHSQTSRKRQNTPKSTTELLVAQNEKMDWRLCERMHCMPTNQGPNPQAPYPNIPHPDHSWHTPIQNYSHGPDYWITNQMRFQCHPNNCGPWMSKSSSLPAMCNNYLWTRYCPTIPWQCV